MSQRPLERRPLKEWLDLPEEERAEIGPILIWSSPTAAGSFEHTSYPALAGLDRKGNYEWTPLPATVDPAPPPPLKHTPGDWWVKDRNEVWTTMPTDAEPVRVGFAACTLSIGLAWEANALLFCASPKLLSLLRDLISDAPTRLKEAREFVLELDKKGASL